jgi:phage shock protein A
VASPTHRARALCPLCTQQLEDDETVTRARSGARVHADCLALSRACGPEYGELARLLASRLRRLEAAAAGNSAAIASVWDGVAELRDELHDLSKRVTDVHSHTLRTLTDHYAKGRDEHDATPDPAA